jgi:hypothetical protein
MKQKSFIRAIASLTLIVFLISFKSVSAQSDTTAIDILLDPGKTMLDSAKYNNGMMLKNYGGPGSFSLDASLAEKWILPLQGWAVTASQLKIIFGDRMKTDL